MSIDKLLQVLKPPAEPFESFDGPWEPVEAQLGTPLPQDYKAFVRIYGSGYFMEFLGVDVPRSANPNVRLERNARVVGDLFRTICEEYDDEDDAPYWFWPERRGLLPFGGTDNGDYLFWHMLGEPDDWPVVVWDRGMQQFETFNVGLGDFLAGLVTGDILPEGFPEDFVLDEPTFEPNSPAPSGS